MPQAVRDTFTQMTGPGSRKQRTDFLNKVILRDKEGNLSLAGTKSATMSGSQSVSNESTFRMDDKALAQTLFMSKFNLDEDKLKRCIVNEEVDVVTHQGQVYVVYVSWRSLKSSSADRRRTNIELGAKKLKLSAEAGHVQALMGGINLELPTELPDMPSKPMIGDGSPDDAGTGSGSGSGSGAPAAASEGKNRQIDDGYLVEKDEGACGARIEQPEGIADQSREDAG